ncbi:unnamed protein product [Amoebophrya sp. A25]|nr:unnamed protein product [Amoebophrya sp. A25]|eukprot:GSA25T00016804001.1
MYAGQGVLEKMSDGQILVRTPILLIGIIIYRTFRKKDLIFYYHSCDQELALSHSLLNADIIIFRQRRSSCGARVE